MKFFIKVSGGKSRSLMSRSDSGQNQIGTRQRSSRTKRDVTLGPRVNMGQATEHAVGKVLRRIKRRVSEIVKAKKDHALMTNENNGNVETERGAKTGIKGVTEDFPEPIAWISSFVRKNYSLG